MLLQVDASEEKRKEGGKKKNKDGGGDGGRAEVIQAPFMGAWVWKTAREQGSVSGVLCVRSARASCAHTRAFSIGVLSAVCMLQKELRC